ncbi:alpha/beta hydrolase [Sphingobium sp. Ant17]|uniref:alpha/beta hydrolase n=1 Tax=Sphingobium sp. Ant17 TaxID=1461752 RepID=UPI0004B899C9|nr:alpha/beta hydrolase [Sphingobium sp. Ant17]
MTLVGWSLGGLYAREYAKYAAHKVGGVVTMGTPFSGDPRANHAWRLYQLVSGFPVDNPPFPCTREAKPPVPTVALWSQRDGVILPECAKGRSGERDKAIEVDCTHMASPPRPKAYWPSPRRWRRCAHRASRRPGATGRVTGRKFTP